MQLHHILQTLSERTLLRQGSDFVQFLSTGSGGTSYPNPVDG